MCEVYGTSLASVLLATQGGQGHGAPIKRSKSAADRDGLQRAKRKTQR